MSRNNELGPSQITRGVPSRGRGGLARPIQPPERSVPATRSLIPISSLGRVVTRTPSGSIPRGVSSSSRAHASILQSASQVGIRGGTFNTAGTQQFNITLNVANQGREEEQQEHLDEPSRYQGAYGARQDHHEALSNPYEDYGSTTLYQNLPVQRSSAIYYRLIAVKGRGSPLWIPGSNQSLEIGYQRQGTGIGDVGIITVAGSFDFLFNIFLPRDHPYNPPELPENFTPFPFSPLDVQKHREFTNDSYLSSASVKKSRTGGLSGLTFESSASEGAILTMPIGSNSEDIANTVRLRNYIITHAQPWYDYIVGVRGREIQNGDVRLVTGWDKSKAWGMATFTNTSAQQEPFLLQFKPIERGNAGRTYGWEYSGSAEVRSGPDAQEKVRIRMGDPSLDGVEYENQCLFIRTLNVTLQDHLWTKLATEFGLQEIYGGQSNTFDTPYSRSSREGSTSATDSSTSAAQSFSAAQHGGRMATVMAASASEESPTPKPTTSVVFSPLKISLSEHPSKGINKMLLELNPTARMAVTEDKDWISVLREDDTILPPAEQLFDRIMTSNVVCIEQDTVFLQPQEAHLSIAPPEIAHNLDLEARDDIGDDTKDPTEISSEAPPMADAPSSLSHFDSFLGSPLHTSVTPTSPTADKTESLHMAGGTTGQKASLRDALLPRLDHASPLLREVLGNCLSRSLAHDFINNGDFIRMFRMLRSEDVRVREPIIGQLRTYIQDSDETARRWLVDARILPKILDAYTSAKDDLLDFMSDCLLPVLGPSFTQDDGGAALFPLLDHDEPRIRASAIQALKNAIDSRYGSIENMARASIVVILHQRITFDDVILELWCRILPKAAPYLTNRAEIDILFASLNDPRGDVREAAAKAISVLAKTSEISRSCMLPTLLHNLENPSPTSIPSIAEAISLSGMTFVSNGKEVELLHHILNNKYIEIRIAAVEATIQSLSKGGSFEHQKLVTATPDILTVALKLHNRPSQRQHSLKLLQSIVNHLSHELLHDAKLARDMFSLFDDPDTGLSNALYQTWSSNPMVLENDMLPELLPLLFEESKVRNPSVAALLRELAPAVVNKLLSRRRLDILVDALMIQDTNVVRAYLRETCLVIEESNEKEKGWFVAQPSFVSAIGKHLKGRDPTMRRHSSTIVGLLSSGSGSRSGKIMDEGIGSYLSWLAVHGGRGTQQESLHALCTLFLAAPDHAERLVTESLPALCNILDSEGLVIEVYTESLHLLDKIVQQSPHPPIIKSGIVLYMVKWLSPKYSVTDIECKIYVFQICQGIAQKSDTGRRALIEAGILPELSALASSRMALEVINACNILKALAHTRVFTHDIISAGLKTSMENITNPFRKSTLQSKEEKSRAQAAAKEALEMLKSSKKQEIDQLSQTPSLSRTWSAANLGADRRARSANEDVAQPERRANDN